MLYNIKYWFTSFVQYILALLVENKIQDCSSLPGAKLDKSNISHPERGPKELINLVYVKPSRMKCTIPTKQCQQ